ncbi:hypothetical protein DFH06DRAFT_1164666 [Mycena polygramma]|nr:hypothetical protein DFH06DRAFT_1164666 [Mycena polygramma]
MSSPFASKLGTNYCPPDAELVQIKQLLIEPRRRLTRLDDEIAIMQKAIDKLAGERDALRSYVEAHMALTSPIRQLPLDIMEEIFIACLPTNRNCVMSAKEAPVILGRICSSWRAIAFSTPRLWASLHIVEPTRHHHWTSLYEAKVAQRLEAATAWLKRSGACPLSISLEGPVDHDILSPPFVRNVDPFPDVLVPFASQWQDVRLVVPMATVEAVLSRLTEDDVPLLRSLKITERRTHAQSTDASQWSLTQSGVLRGPSLTNFRIRGRDAPGSVLALPLRWAQLTVVSLMAPAWIGGGQVMEILSRCPKLQTCKLLVQDTEEGLLADLTVECQFLHTLELHCIVVTPGLLLRRLSLPLLKTLKLSGQADLQTHSELTMNSFVSFLVSSTRLETITIDTSLFSKAFLMDVLRGLPPSLRHLHIRERLRSAETMAPLDDESFAVLTASPAILCPALQELVISSCRNVSDEALLRFILSRKAILRLVEIKFDRIKQVDILPSLQQFAEPALQTNITYICPAPPMFSPWQGLPDAPLYGMFQPAFSRGP